jgi:hypothetical protein
MNNLTFLPSFLFGCCLLLLGQFATAQAPQNGPVQQQGYVLMNQPSNTASNQFNEHQSNPFTWRQGHRAGNGRWQGQQHKGYVHGQVYSSQGPQQQHGQPCFYGPNYGWQPVSAASFNNGYQSIRKYTFDSDRLSAANRFVAYNYFTVQQICQMMQLFTFECTKLKFAKMAFGRTCDIQNYYQVYGYLNFPLSRKDLDRYIQQHY